MAHPGGTDDSRTTMSPSPVIQNGHPVNQVSQMDGPATSVTTKDPRRANPPTPRPMPNIENLLRELISNTCSMAMIRTNQERVAKRKRLEQEERSKAMQRQFQFPAQAARHKATMGDLEAEYARIKQKCEEQSKAQEQLIQDLAAVFRSSDASRLDGVKKDMDVVKEQASRAESAAQRATQNVDSMNTKITTLGEQVSVLESKYIGFNGRLQECIADLVLSRPSKSELKDALHELGENFKTKHASILGQLEDFRRNVTTQQQSPSPRDPDLIPVRDLQGLADQVRVLQSDQQNLASQFESLRGLQEVKDNLISEELETTKSSATQLQTTVEAQARSVSALQQGISTLQNQQQLVSNASPQAVKDLQVRLNGMDGGLRMISEEMRKHAETINALQVAVHSLQTRCNNLTTESVVAQMAAATQKLYPYASTAQKDIEKFNGEVSGLDNRVKAVETRLAAAERVQSKAKEERDESVKDMDSEKNRLVQEIEGLKARLNSVEGRAQMSNRYSEAHTATVKQLTSFDDRFGEMENVMATKLATVLSDIIDLKSTIASVEDRFAKLERTKDDLNEEMIRVSGYINALQARAEEDPREREQQEEQATNGHSSQRDNTSHSSMDESESLSMSSVDHCSPRPQDIPSSPRSLQRPPPGNGPIRIGRHLAEPPSPHAPKKRKRSPSPIHRVSR